MSILDDVVGLFTGSSSSAASVSSSVNLTVGGQDKPIALTVGGQDKPMALTETVELKPVAVSIGGQDKPIALTENIDLKPVTLNENIDLRPVAVDTCQTLRLAPLPDTSVCNPYRHRIAMSLLGFEILTLAFNGETEQQIRSPHRTQRTQRTRREYSRPPGPRRVVGQPDGISVRVIDADE